MGLSQYRIYVFTGDTVSNTNNVYHVIYYELLFFATNKHKYIGTVGVGATSVNRGVIGGK